MSSTSKLQRFGTPPKLAATILGVDNPISVNAAGAAQATATSVSNPYVRITGGAGGVRLHAGAVKFPGDRVSLVNFTGASVNVFVPTGHYRGAVLNGSAVLASGEHTVAIYHGEVSVGNQRVMRWSFDRE